MVIESLLSWETVEEMPQSEGDMATRDSVYCLLRAPSGVAVVVRRRNPMFCPPIGGRVAISITRDPEYRVEQVVKAGVGQHCPSGLNVIRERITIWTDEGLPVVRGGTDGRGEALARGSSICESTDAANASYVRTVCGLPAGYPVYLNDLREPL